MSEATEIPAITDSNGWTVTQLGEHELEATKPGMRRIHVGGSDDAGVEALHARIAEAIAEVEGLASAAGGSAAGAAGATGREATLVVHEDGN